MADLEKLTLADELTQGATHLVVAAEVGKVGAQKDVASRSGDSSGHSEFERSTHACQNTVFLRNASTEDTRLRSVD